MFLESPIEMTFIRMGGRKEPHRFCVSKFPGEGPFPRIFFFLILLFLLFSEKEGFPQDRTEEGIKSTSSGKKSENLPAGSPRGVGVVEVPRTDGRKDKIYFSTMTPEEESRSAVDEKEKADRSLEMLRNIIIDRRPR
jgi:hypothetical protein